MKPKTTDPDTFKLFHAALLRGASEGDVYIPHYIALEPNGKDPIKGFSWAKNPLTYEEAVKRLEKGGNVGIAAKTEDPLVIVDIDDLTATDVKTVKETLTAKSRKRLGIHLYYFRTEGAEIPNIPTDKEGEVRANNQYVVAPGSFVPVSEEELARIPEADRENAGRYTLELARPPTSIALEELPEVFLAQLAKGETAYRQGQKEPFKPHPNLSPLYKLTIKDVLPGVVEGRRIPHPFHDSETGHNFVVVGGLAHCWRHNVSLNPVQLLAVKYGLLSCLDAGTGHQNSGAGPSKVTPNVLEKVWERAVGEGLVRDTDKKPATIREKQDDGSAGEDEKQVLKLPKEFNAAVYGEHLLRRFHVVTFRDNSEMFVYRDGIYAPNGESYLAEAAQELLLVRDSVSTHYVKEAVGYVKRATYQERDGYEAPTNLINLKNGVLDIHTGGLLPHTPDKVFFSALPVEYNSEAICPSIMAFLEQILEPQDIPIIQEVAGYCLLREYPIAKAVMLLGDGENGKSCLIELLCAFLGHENVSAVTLQALTYNRFAPSDLYHKLANLCADLPQKGLTDTGKFKMLTGGDVISAEKKGQAFFSYINYAKFLFSCNKLPEAEDDTNAFYRRWILINFPRTFDGANRERRDVLMARITAPTELSGFLNWALAGLKRLLENGGFSNSKTTAEIRTEYVKRSNPVRAFVMDFIEVDPDGEVENDKMAVFNEYKRFCETRHLQKLTFPKFSEKLRNEVEGIGERRVGGKGEERVRVWTGFRLLSDRCPGNVQAKNNSLDATLDRDVLPSGYVQAVRAVRAKTLPQPDGPTISREVLGVEGDSAAGVEKCPDYLDTRTGPGPAPGPGNPPQNERNITVLNALKKTTSEYDWAAVGELSQATKLSAEIVKVALQQLTKDGHAYSPEPGKWRAT